MTHEFDEVRLTAYALGELDAAEAEMVEALLARDPKARAEVAAIRAFGASLSDHLGRDAAGAPLTDDQKRSIAQAAREPAPTPARAWPRGPWMLAAASALLFVVIAGMGIRENLLPRRDAEVAFERSGSAAPTQADHDRLEAELKWIEARRAPEGRIDLLNESARALEARPEPAPPQPRVYSAQDRPQVDPDGGVGTYQAWIERRGAPADKPAVTIVDKHKAPGAVPSTNLPASTVAPGQKTVDEVRKIQDEETRLSAEAYAALKENEFVRALGEDALSTFGLDVDTASYSNVRRLLRQGARPDKGAIRIEELINYFEYDYPRPVDGKPLAMTVEVGQCPWAPAHRLALVALKAKTIDRAERGRANLVFLIDVSGSMEPANKLPLVKRSLQMLVDQLRPDDRIAMVVYAGASGLVMPSTAVNEKRTILDAIDRLNAGGSTNGGAGIELAYSVAKDNYVQGGINRVILCTDGDFNVGTTSESSLVELIQGRAKSGVFLTVLGFGMGNLKDSTLQKLADKGNGSYGYIDTESEAKKLFVNQVDATLVTVAKDARIQVEFNPAIVGAWRLVGYEKRLMPNRDFHDDTKDAGEVGSGHTVTALYEIIPAGSPELEKLSASGPLRYQATVAPAPGSGSGELMTVRLRYKEPDGDRSALVETSASDDRNGTKPMSRSFRWACAVAMFGMELRGSAYKGLTNWALIDELAREAKGDDPSGLRSEFLELIKLAGNFGQR